MSYRDRDRGDYRDYRDDRGRPRDQGYGYGGPRDRDDRGYGHGAPSGSYGRQDNYRDDRRAPPPSGPRPGAKAAGYTLFVGGLSDAVRSADVAREFERFGQLVRVDIPLRDGRSKGFAFVEFIYKQDCEKALAETRGRLRIDGKPVTVELTQRDFQAQPPRPAERSQPPPRRDDRDRERSPPRRERTPPPRPTSYEREREPERRSRSPERAPTPSERRRSASRSPGRRDEERSPERR